MGCLLRSLFGLMLIPLVAAVGYAMLVFLRTNADGWAGSAFMWGMVAFVPFGIMLFFSPAPLIQVLEHELGHYALARLLGLEVYGLAASLEGGVTLVERGCLASLVAVAPYFLPLFTIPLVVLRPFISGNFQVVVDFLIGFTLAWHYFSVVAEVMRGQSDVTKAGPIFWLTLTLLFNAGILVFIVGVLTEDLSSGVSFVEDSLKMAQETYGVAIDWLRALLAKLT
jgi:hypothetical protein